MMVIMNSNLFINRQCKRSNNKKKNKKKRADTEFKWFARVANLEVQNA